MDAMTWDIEKSCRYSVGRGVSSGRLEIRVEGPRSRVYENVQGEQVGVGSAWAQAREREREWVWVGGCARAFVQRDPIRARDREAS